MAVIRFVSKEGIVKCKATILPPTQFFVPQQQKIELSISKIPPG